MTESLNNGDTAPDFCLPRDGGDELCLTDLRGKQVVLYFYPKDDTKGCTAEAIAFTQHRQAFEDVNTVIIGMSPDSVTKHDKFIAKYELDIPLLADEDKTILQNYGVWVEKSMYGRKYMGVERSTFLIDENGIIRQIWRKVKVTGHVEAVLKAASELYEQNQNTTEQAG